MMNEHGIDQLLVVDGQRPIGVLAIARRAKSLRLLGSTRSLRPVAAGQR